VICDPDIVVISKGEKFCAESLFIVARNNIYSESFKFFKSLRVLFESVFILSMQPVVFFCYLNGTQLFSQTLCYHYNIVIKGDNFLSVIHPRYLIFSPTTFSLTNFVVFT